MKQYETPVVLWRSEWKEVGTEVSINKNKEKVEVKVYSLIGIINKEHRHYKGK